MSQFYVVKLLLDLIYHFPLALLVSRSSFLYTSEMCFFGMPNTYIHEIYDSITLALKQNRLPSFLMYMHVEETYDRVKAG